MRGSASRMMAKATAEPTMAKTKMKTAKVIIAERKHPKGIVILLLFSFTISYSIITVKDSSKLMPKIERVGCFVAANLKC
jgi:tagatose-1,6-bisphosphate aldolase